MARDRVQTSLVGVQEYRHGLFRPALLALAATRHTKERTVFEPFRRQLAVVMALAGGGGGECPGYTGGGGVVVEDRREVFDQNILDTS